MTEIIFDHKAVADAVKRLAGHTSEIAEGDVCPVAVCAGHMAIMPAGGACGCSATRAPCWACENADLVCDQCGWKPA